jgi:hypothetical protein
MYHIQSRLTKIGPQTSLPQRTLLIGDKGTLHKAHTRNRGMFSGNKPKTLKKSNKPSL